MKSFLKGKSPPDSLNSMPGYGSRLGPVRVIDPSLFTVPYDAALVAALRDAGVVGDGEERGFDVPHGAEAAAVARHRVQ